MTEDSLLEQQINLLLTSYGLTRLLELNDIEEYAVVDLLVRGGMLDLEEYFYYDEEVRDDG